MSLTVLSIAYPFAPVRSNTAGGAEQVLLTLDRALVRKGHRSVVVARCGSAPAGTLIPVSLPEGVIGDEVRKEVYGIYRRTIERTLHSEKIDIVHFHGLDFDSYLSTPGVPVLVTLHLPSSWYSGAALMTRRSGTYFTCVSRSQELACPRIPNLLPYIGNGVDVDAFGRAKGEGKYALALGRICPEKGYHIAFEAAKRAGMPLYLAGEVFPYETHTAYFREKIHPHVDGLRYRFLGPVGFSRKRQLLAGARCLLVPSLVPETSSLVAMEALASGTPVIAFPAGALAEIVEDGKTGIIVGSAEEMAEAIGKVGRIDPTICRATARERFHVDAMVEKYIDRYNQILERQVLRR